MNKSTDKKDESVPKPRRFPLWLFLTIVFMGIAAPFVYVAASKLYSQYVEISAPVIEFTVVPRGVGIAPVTFKFHVTDQGAGLDEVVVRARQRGRVRELFKRKMKGVPSFEEEMSFAGSKSNFQEGALELEVVAFDRAFWSNRGEKTLQLRVDYRKPKIEALTTQHNARKGGAQLIFYRVFDEDPAASGVKIGSKVFQGFQARGLDPLFEDPNLYAAFYAIDVSQEIDPKSIILFAEDQAGNGVSTDFYNKVMDRPERKITVPLSEEFLRGSVTQLFEQNISKVSNAMDAYDKDPFLAEIDPLLKRFKAINEVLRKLNQADIGDRLAARPRFESFLKQFFLKQGATSKIQFGDRISYSYNGQEIGTGISTGNEFVLAPGQRDIIAVNDGIVAFAENRGSYGRVVAIDHGLGVASVYAQLDEMKVQAGDTIKRGEIVGTAGTTGFAMKPGALVEMRVHGIPVDPVEWWDASWFNQHVIGKIDEMKTALGIQVYKPL